jgi:hypothetical protein
MWMVVWFVLLVIFLLFGFVVAFGAPYLPTLSPQVKAALDLVDLKPGQTLLELGSGDGRILIAAAERGLNVVGYELNPLLALYSWLRTRKYKGRVKVVCGNFWRRKLPPAEGIFVFLLNRYMAQLDTKLAAELPRPFRLVSFAFEIPDRSADKQQAGVFLYRYSR